MTSKSVITVGSIALAAFAISADAATTLKVFVGGQEHPDLMRTIFSKYEKTHKNVHIKVQSGGATSAQQQQYLSTVLAGHSPKIDIFLIDVTRPAQYGAAKWAAPLADLVKGKDKTLLKPYLKAYSHADRYKGKVVAMPGFADAMFLYYRKDLLKKYGLKPPQTWPQLVKEARMVKQKQKDTNLQGLSFQGAPIEGTVCTFLVPFWDAGGSVVSNGHVNINSEAGKKALTFLKNTIYKSKVAPPNTSQVATDDTRKTFQDGRAVFAINWAYAWNWFQKPKSSVKGKVGVVRLPTFKGHQHNTCLGGWQWAVSAYSNHKKAAARVAKYLSSKQVSRYLAIHASDLPVYKSLYTNPAVLKANPWFKEALPVVKTARSRPVTPRYSEVSEIVRSNVNSVLANQESVQEGLTQMQHKLQGILAK